MSAVTRPSPSRASPAPPLTSDSSPSPSRSADSDVKRAVDIAGSLIGLILLLPVLITVMLLIRVTSPGPALYRQERVGLDGRVFKIAKFRTMHIDAEVRLAALRDGETGAGPLFKLENDPRITGVGRLLRKFSVDELPQLWNVLRGDMSLVGPRPALQCEVDEYCSTALRRLEAVPGMTGAWQVGGRSDLTWEQSLELDVGYIDGWSHREDARILLATVRAVVVPVGAY